jgi:HlyD family secretion protein
MADSLRILFHTASWPAWLKPLALVLAILMLGGVAYLIFVPVQKANASAGAQQGGGEWLEIKRCEFRNRHLDEGDLRPVKVTALSFLRWGKVAWLIPEGTRVKKGDRIVSLETKEIEDTLRNLEQDLAAAEKNLASQEQTRDLEVKRLQTELQAETDRAAFAKLKENELLAHPNDLEKQEQRVKLDGAKARLTAAQAELSAFEPLAEKGFGTVADLHAKKLTVEKSGVEMTRADAKYELALAGAKPEDRRKAALETENADLGLKIKQLDAADHLDDLNAKVLQAQRELDHVKRKIDRNKQWLEQSTIYAPHAGVVVHRPINRNNKKCEVGESVGPWAYPVELPNYDKMKVRTQVPESFIRRIVARSAGATDGKGPRAGSQAFVKVTTLPDRVYEAEVIWIDGWARDRNSKLSDADIKAQGLSGVRVFDVEVELQESDPASLREGFRASVEFPVEVLNDVIVIPMQAVTMREGGAFVQVQQGKDREWRQIETGAQCMGELVITSGLEEGEKVLVPRKAQARADETGRKREKSDGSKDKPEAGGKEEAPKKAEKADSREDGNRSPDPPRRVGGRRKGGN